MALGTERCDRPAAEAAVRAAYQMAGLAEPRVMVWMDSPLGGAFAAAVIQHCALGRQLWEQLWDQLRDRLRDQLWAQIGDQIENKSGGRSGSQGRDLLWGPVWGTLRGNIGAQLRDQLSSSVSAWGDGFWMVFYQQALAIAEMARSPRLDALAAAQRLTSWWWPMSGIAVLVDRPVGLHRDDQGRLHCPDGPALAYADECEVFAWHGIHCDQRIITDDLTAQDWLHEPNAEWRRCIAERIGYERLLDKCEAVKVATDDYGTLWRIPDPGHTRLARRSWGQVQTDEDVVLVDVLNSTPEPDGSVRRYVLRVPPKYGEPGSKPRDAIGWTFGLPAGAYQPTVMT